MSRYRPLEPDRPKLSLEERRLVNAVKRFRRLANLHDASADSALVAYAFGAGKGLAGAEGVRSAAIALETAARATIDPREASGQEPGAGRGSVVDVRSRLLS
jgi:hypothetical protein